MRLVMPALRRHLGCSARSAVLALVGTLGAVAWAQDVLLPPAETGSVGDMTGALGLPATAAVAWYALSRLFSVADRAVRLAEDTLVAWRGGMLKLPPIRVEVTRSQDEDR